MGIKEEKKGESGTVGEIREHFLKDVSYLMRTFE